MKFLSVVVALGYFLSSIDFSDAKCETQPLTDEDKKKLLALHNEYRAKVANGNEPGQPQGANILELVWDDDLAATAQGLADKGAYNHDQNADRATAKYKDVGQNIARTVFQPNDIKADWGTAIKQLYDEVLKFDPKLIDNYVFVYDIGHYSQLLWATTESVGCGYSSRVNEQMDTWCTGVVVCNYGPPGNYAGQTMYVRGPPASKCGDLGESTNYPGLCKP